MTPRAWYGSRRAVLVANLLMVLVALWAFRHVYMIVFRAEGLGQNNITSHFTVFYAFAFAMLALQVLLYCFERPYTVDGHQQQALDALRVIVNVPVCNEDAEVLRQCLLALLDQSRRLNVIHVVVNGPNTVDYGEIEDWARETSWERGINLIWSVQQIAGKRHAQAATVERFLRPQDIFVSIDSDSCLEREAVAEGLKPFAQPKVMSVAGVALVMNTRAKLLTRLSSLWFTTGQLVDRSSFSVFGSVLVNSGAIAFYRGHLIIDNLDSYTHETFFGTPVQFSDDSFLTMYALNKGRAVQQPTSFAFTFMPETFSHHFRQQLRWMRGAFIRSWWRFRYLSVKQYAFWGHMFRWWQFALSTIIFATLFIVVPITHYSVFPYLFYLLIIPLLVAYGQALRFLTITRSDQTFRYRLGTWLMTPAPAMWSYVVLRCLRYYAMATCRKTGWGTRATVEVQHSGGPK
jgi:hyaluronan synthase